VRAPSGQTPRRRSIMPRNSINRKLRPCFENLESKQLLSVGVLTHAAQTVVQTPAPVSSHVKHQGVTPDGTGKSVVIVTS
jgi:hypothetical protein